MRYLKALCLVMAVGVLSSGCSDSTGPDNPGFDATISGDLELDISGDAIFGVSHEAGVDRWMIFLLNGVFLGLDYDMIAFSRESSDTPIPVGTHTISEAASNTLDDDDIGAAYMIGRHNGSLGVYSSVTGTLTITSANSDLVVGSFDFTASVQIAVGPDVRDVRELTLTGTFTAEAGSIPSGATSS